jgi:hypothetical protein
VQEKLKEIKTKYGKVSLGDTTVDMVSKGSVCFWRSVDKSISFQKALMKDTLVITIFALVDVC